MDQTKGKVCVTGASGFLASWLVKRLLLEGYEVTGTVRDPGFSLSILSLQASQSKTQISVLVLTGNAKKLAHLWKLEGAKERLRLVKADLMEDGSFDNAIMGCQGVFHTASPEEILKPAIEGTLNVLRSCRKNPSLKRVVLTSSSSTVRIRDDFDPNIPLDESVWTSVELCKRFQVWYALSKTLAEQAAWKYCEENGIDLVTVLPSFLVGPSLPPDLCSTASDVLGLLKGTVLSWQHHQNSSRYLLLVIAQHNRRNREVSVAWTDGLCSYRRRGKNPHPSFRTRSSSRQIHLQL
ncbi:hypothetical protein Bca101_053683 [Brassica carinata]